MWHFRRKARGEKIRDPIQGEFFATEAIENPAQALVRESVQNSLDAAEDGSAVTVRFFLATGKHAADAAEVAPYFDGAWQHLSADRNGLREPPTPSAPCPYLLVEDFGTSGLTGDPEQSDPVPGQNNPFLLFFRAEGLSEKSDKDRGRWGVGKFVFPRSSTASCHFGFTIRSDDSRQLLLGAATLKSHAVEGETYCPDGLYGVLGEEDFVSPIEDPAVIRSFRQIFSIRRQHEPGLSVVVPYVDPEITFSDLLVGAVKDYFLPVLAGDLEISIESPDQSIRLSADTLESTLQTITSEVGTDLPALVTLAAWSSSVEDADRIALAMPDPARSPKWTEDVIPPDAAERIRRKLSAGDPLAIRVPVTVHHRVAGSRPSHFDIYVRSDKTSDGRSCYVREGIIISDVRGKRARELRSLVIVNDAPLAQMLGDSENPAHTQWQKESSHFRGNYKLGPGILAYVINALGEILRIINQTQVDADPSLTIDFFSVPPRPDESGDETDDQDESDDAGTESETPTVKVDRQKRPLRIGRHTGGFSIGPGDLIPTVPFLIEVRCAYDIRSGNPLRKYALADFDLTSPTFDLATDTHGISIRKAAGNYILAQVDQDDFLLSVAGFDSTRDVYVRADARAHSDANPST